jgi:hypothetical protein
MALWEGTMIPRTIDVYAFALAVLLTGIGVKLMSLLPERYYFTFSQVVDAKNQSQFLTRPELPSPSSFCRSLKDEETAQKIDAPQTITDACEKMESSIGDAWIPTNESIDGVPLHSAENKENLKALLAELRAKASLLRDGINAQGRTYKKAIEGLNDAALEKVLYADGTANLTSVALYTMDTEDDESDTAYKSTETLRADPKISELLGKQTELDDSDRTELEEEGSKANEGAKYLANSQVPVIATIKSFLMKQDKFLFWPALALKLLPALIMGMIMAAFYREKALEVSPLAAAFTAFLFCWPVIVLWDNVVSEEWIDYRPSFYILYIAYIITFFFAARLGAMLMLVSPAVRIPQAAVREIEWNKVLATAAATIISSGVTGAVTWTLAMAHS